MRIEGSGCRFQGGLKRGALLICTLVLTSCSGSPDTRNLKPETWLFTPDQRGSRLFAQGEYAEAAECFADPMRQGAAWYRAKEFRKAAALFSQVGTPEGLFNQGNALLFQGEYDAAIAVYEPVLKARPDWEAPRINLAVAEARKKAMAPPDDAVAREKLTKDDAADEIVFDDRAKNNPNAATDVVEGGAEPLDDAATREMWLKRVETRPVDFLRAKFAYQRAVADQGPESSGQ